MSGDERRARLVHADAHRDHLEEDRHATADGLEHERRRDRRPLRADQQQRDIHFGDGEHLIRRLARRDDRQMPRTGSVPCRHASQEPSRDQSGHGNDRRLGDQHGGHADREPIGDRKRRDARSEQRNERDAVERKLDGEGAERGAERHAVPDV